VIIGGSLFFGLLKSQQISESDNTSWTAAYIVSFLIDLVVVEFLAIIMSTLLLKHVGSHPAAMGPLRNYVIKFGPRVIRDAPIDKAAAPKANNTRKQKQGPSSDRKVHREKPAADAKA